MMNHNNFPLLRKSLIISFGIFVSMVSLFGCGGGGGGGAQPIITPENKIPTASITSPTGTQFNEGENIAFGGSATDEEDGPLDGASLVWTSNIDGTIGTGSAVTTSALTAGDHEITLTATDSEGGVRKTDPPTLISISQTRFVKMGTQTTGVTDAANAFDGDHETAATIVTPDTEFIHFKAFIGGAETFLFNIKFGASTAGSRIAVQGLYAADTTWRPMSDIGLTESENTTTVMVKSAQEYKDTDGYINLRLRWEGGGIDENATIYEIWRIDPAYAGGKTTGANSPELAFDGNSATGATITTPWDGSAPFLHFRAFVGIGTVETFDFNISHNNIGPTQSLVVEIEDPTAPAADNWIHLQSYNLNETSTRTFTVANVQDYLDADGYVSLRAFWVGFGDGNQLEIYEISRIDSFFVGSKTPDIYITNPKNAVDKDETSFATIYYYWGELEGEVPRYDFLHVKSYLGDASECVFSFQSAASAPGSVSELIVEGETEPDKWSVIERVNLPDTPTETIVRLANARQYVDADGELSLLFRWESDSILHDAQIYHIRRN